MKYLLLLNRAEDDLPEPGTPAAQAMLREYTAAVQAMAEVARATGRLDVAEDSVQDACVVAVQQWTAGHVPRDPQAWLTGVARHKALDRLRRESRRPAKEAATAALAPGPAAGATGTARSADEDLWLIYLCCHPALSPEARIALTLRAVGGLTTAEIAAAFLVPPTLRH